MDLCFMCTKDYHCVPVDDRIVSEVEYLIPEITIIKLGIPLRICSVCEGALDAFGKFKRYSVESSRRLESSIRARGAPGPPLHTGRAPVVGHNDTSDTQPEKIEAVYIKEEPVEETWPECHPHINSSSLNPALRVDRTSPDTYRALSNSPNLLESLLLQNELHKSEMSSNITLHTDISIKEEQLELTSQDQQIYSNIKKNICKKEYAESNTMSDNKDKREHKTEEENSRADTREEVWEKISAEPEEILIKENIKNNQIDTKKSSLCNKNFKTKHKIEHESDTTSSNKLLIRKDNLSLNEKKVNRQIKQFPCVLCKKTFVHKYNLNRHIELHNGIKNFQCSICKKRFLKKHNLKQHLNTHTQNDVCGNTYTETFTSETKSKSHTTEQENSQVNKAWQCSVCHKIFRYKCLLIKHMRNHSDFKEFKCEICDKSFAQKSTLTAHKKIHSEVRKFHCNVCNKSFKWKCNLRDHMAVHSDIKDFECDICNKTFARKNTLRIHKSTHSDVRAFQCKLCNRSFRLKSFLDSHMISHSDVKDFQCDICSQLFKYKSTLLSHMKCHLNKRDFQCPTCKKFFVRKHSLTRHLINVCFAV